MKQIPYFLRASALSALSALITLMLTGCGTNALNQAPVVERSLATASKPNAPVTSTTTVQAHSSAVTSTAASNTRPTPVSPPVAPIVTGYTVKRGDTLYGIALENGLAYRDIAAWNNITNPNYIQAEQILRLSAPPVDPSATATSATAVPVPISTGSISVSPPLAATLPSAVPATVPTTGDIVWSWPVKGKIVESYTEGKSKGISIGGNIGDAIFAAADGKVVYSGSALKGYGPMLIIKHNDVYITAYAHNSKLLVKEEQTVKRGQHIADMGNLQTEDGKPKLHFELRRNGKPLDPTKILPSNTQ
jgi:lipoprotein NlpD